MAMLSDGELVKKTLRTTLVMLGSTALWLGLLSGAVIVSTGPSSPAETKVEKAAGPATGGPGAPTGPARAGERGGGGPGGVNPRSVHPSRPMPKPEPPHAGDPI
jgi:hypothetical protein